MKPLHRKPRSRPSAAILLLFFPIATRAQDPGFDGSPGVDRWSIKTSIKEHAKRRNLSLRDIYALDNPISRKGEAPDSARITKAVGPKNMREGDMVTTEGWMKLVALEKAGADKSDGDYHIQLCTTQAWDDTCLIVEVPWEGFVTDDSLHAWFANVRQFIRTRILKKNKNPSTGGNVIDSAYVAVKGPLFFDAWHLKNDGTTQKRGKKGNQSTSMNSYTCWEIHPVVSMWFAKRPK